MDYATSPTKNNNKDDNNKNNNNNHRSSSSSLSSLLSLRLFFCGADEYFVNKFNLCREDGTSSLHDDLEYSTSSWEPSITHDISKEEEPSSSPSKKQQQKRRLSKTPTEPTAHTASTSSLSTAADDTFGRGSSDLMTSSSSTSSRNVVVVVENVPSVTTTTPTSSSSSSSSPVLRTRRTTRQSNKMTLTTTMVATREVKTKVTTTTTTTTTSSPSFRSSSSLRYIRGDNVNITATMKKSPNNTTTGEVHDCYGGYRMDQIFVNDILRHVNVSMDGFFNKKDGRGRGGGGVVTNAWSEPLASSVKVRGRRYLNDGKKVASQPSLLALIGVDNLRRPKSMKASDTVYDSNDEQSFVSRLRRVCRCANIATPFLLILNFNLPWGNLMSYFYRPDATGAGPFNDDEKDEPAERLWRSFLESSDTERNKKLKIIPKITNGPWFIKKMVGTQPALLGQKLPVTYHGSLKDDNYLEISLDVTKGSQFANSIANTVAGKADAVTVDLCFVIEGTTESELPERVLGGLRLHHVNMKSCQNMNEWKQKMMTTTMTTKKTMMES